MSFSLIFFFFSYVFTVPGSKTTRSKADTTSSLSNHKRVRNTWGGFRIEGRGVVTNVCVHDRSPCSALYAGFPVPC